MHRLATLCATALITALAACDSDSAAPLDADGADASSSDSASSADTTRAPDAPAPILDPACRDGRYDEPLPDEQADLADLIAAYNRDTYHVFVDDVLTRRFPLGAYLVTEANRVGSATFGNCIGRFTNRKDTASDIISQLSTIVHECGHILDTQSGSFSADHYQITTSLAFDCQRGDTTTRGGDTFARSRINDDEFSALWPNDSYRDIYLDGDPDDAVFESGDQGFSMLLEETLQYVNSLATSWAFRDQQGRGVATSARDGILTFLWYTTRYLRMARLDYPEAYSRLSTDSCWREAILTVWGRAWRYLDLSKAERSLGIDDRALLPLATTPELLDEIDLLRRADSCF